MLDEFLLVLYVRTEVDGSRVGMDNHPCFDQKGQRGQEGSLVGSWPGARLDAVDSRMAFGGEVDKTLSLVSGIKAFALDTRNFDFDFVENHKENEMSKHQGAFRTAVPFANA